MIITFQDIADALRGMGYVGSTNDIMYAWLRGLGYEGALPDMLYQYLSSLGYAGSISDMLSRLVLTDIGGNSAILLTTSDGKAIEFSDGKYLGVRI